MPEQSSVRNISHEQLHHHKVFMHCLVESWSGFRRGCASDRLLQIGMGFRVVKLYSSDTTEIVVVSCKLGVARGRWECGLGDKFVGLIIQVVGYVTPEKTVNKRSMGFFIVPE